MLPNKDRDPLPDDTPDKVPEGGALGPTFTPPGKSTPPTFPSEAESLLRHLNLGPAKPASPSPPPANGTFPQIPNYQIECEIGRGGMGVVYKARHVSLNRTDAVKMILASAHASPSEVARFMTEAEAIAAVEHPNVVQVYGMGHSDGRPYFVMELVEGENLSALLKARSPLTPDAAAKLIASVASGVQAAHDAGIVHRDLKPANILLAGVRGQWSGSKNPLETPRPLAALELTPDSRRLATLVPKVSDFGLAKRLSSDLTRSQAVMGTPAYMAPEQAGKAKFVGPGADVYALGAILYECLTGKPPFNSPDAWSLIRQVMEDAPEPLRKTIPGVPRDLELICLKCLEKEPHHRYPTAAALADDLTRFLRREPVSVRPIGLPTRALRWARRHPAPAGLIALVALLLLFVPPLLVWEQGRLDRRDVVAEEARKREEAARIAQAEAEKARIAAEQLAATRELFALQTKLRNRAVARPLAWVRDMQADLPRAVMLAGDDPDTRRELRSAAADALMASDLIPMEPILKGFTASSAATDPTTGMVALGEFHAWAFNTCRVRLIDPATGAVKRELTFTAGLVRSPKGELRSVPDGVRALAFSRDGTRLFAGTRSSMVVRFDLDKPANTAAATWNAGINALEQLAVSPDRKTVYGLCRPDGPVLAWPVETGKPVKRLEADDKVGFGAFAVLPSGDVIAGHGHRLYHWNAEHKLVRSVERTVGLRMTATESSLLLLGEGASLGIYDRDSFELIDRYLDPNLRRTTHDDPIRTIALHPSSAVVATAGGDRDRSVKVWGLTSGLLVGTVTVPGNGPIAVAWSGDGQYLVATADGHIARWRFVAAESQAFACLSARAIESAALLTDGRVAALAEARNGKRELLAGFVNRGADVHTLADKGGHGRLWVSAAPDGGVVATLDEPGIFLWKPGTPIPPLGFTTRPARYPSFSPDGKTIWAVVNSTDVHAFDAKTRALLGQWSNASEDIFTGLANLDALAVGRDLVVAGGVNGAVYGLAPATCKPAVVFPRSADPVLSIAITPDDSLVVAGTQKGYVRILKPATKSEIPQPQSPPVHPGGIAALAINRDGTLLATGGRDRAVRLWKRVGDRFEPLFTVSDLPGMVQELEFSPADGRLLVLLSHAHAVRVWDIDKLHAQLAGVKLGW